MEREIRDMENNSFRTVAFGGFDKQDVIRYIEQSAKEAADAQEALRRENEALRTDAEALRTQVRELEERLASETALRERAQAESAEREDRCRALEGAREEADRLSAQVEQLRPEAEAYARFRDRVGDIECDAHKRAAELEASTAERLRRTAETFRVQYTSLMDAFGASADYVTAELRKMEVTLTQLPRAMDRPGAELKELSALLEQESGNQKK